MSESTVAVWEGSCLPDFLDAIIAAEDGLGEFLRQQLDIRSEEIKAAGGSMSIADRVKWARLQFVQLDARSKYICLVMNFKDEHRALYMFYDSPDYADSIPNHRIVFSIGADGNGSELVKATARAFSAKLASQPEPFQGKLHFREGDSANWSVLPAPNPTLAGANDASVRSRKPRM